jgi:hypothetical protein
VYVVEPGFVEEPAPAAKEEESITQDQAVGAPAWRPCLLPLHMRFPIQRGI